MIRKNAVALTLVVSLSLGALSGCAEEKNRDPDFSGVSSVCELATLKCYYHNVAEAEKDRDQMFGWFFNAGYKKLWIEYDGIVELGVDVSQVSISQPNAEGVVEVHVPEAQVQNVYIDKQSIGDPITETGFNTQITTEEKTTAFSEAQASMEDSARANTAMLASAHERAKKIIEQYVVNVGKELGETYTVKWV